jgi:ATP-binding cassette subfamily B multidrug efflux pump
LLSNPGNLGPYMVRYRWRYAAGFFMLCWRGGMAAALPYLIGEAVDYLAGDFTLQGLAGYAGAMMAVAALKAVGQYYMRWILITISRDIEYDLRADLSAHLVTLSKRFYDTYRTGDLMARATNDLAQVRSLLGPGVMYTGEIVVTFIAVLIVMASTDWVLTLLIFAPMPLVSLAVSYFGKRTHGQFQKVQERFSAISARVQEHLANVRMLRAYGQGPQEQERFRALNDDYLNENVGLIKIWRVFYPLLEVLVGLTYIAVLGFGGWRVLRGEITLGTFLMFISFLPVLIWPMVGLGVVVNITQRGTASLERLSELMKRQPLIADDQSTDYGIDGVRGDIELDGVTVQYPGTVEPALKDVSLYVPAGHSLAIVGSVGSGKSTLVNLIPRLLDPTKGRVLIDGFDAKTVPLKVLRDAIGYVPQETFLFSRSIEHNIRLGAPDAEDWAIEEAVVSANFESDVADFPEGLQTLVGERGITLSGGQKQRTSMARALIRDPRILILDDATASVDTETEHQILTRLQSKLRNRTTLMVSHRVSAAQYADQIIVLDEGRIVETGSHQELLDLGGLYNRLHSRQLIEEELTKT